MFVQTMCTHDNLRRDRVIILSVPCDQFECTMWPLITYHTEVLTPESGSPSSRMKSYKTLALGHNAPVHRLPFGRPPNISSNVLKPDMSVSLNELQHIIVCDQIDTLDSISLQSYSQ